MGTIVIHAGMPKAGSSSVQSWLKANATDLLERHDVRLVAAVPDETANRVTVEPRTNHKIKTHALAQFAFRRSGGRLDGLIEGLDRFASRHRTVVLTGEGLAHVFWRFEEGFLASLEELSTRHRVRVAYYVRPQHVALESAWKQWGFRSGRSPSAYLAKRSRSLHYFETYTGVGERAPGISFEPRPAVRDMLPGGGVVGDFAHRFLGVPDEAAEADGLWANESLPLELANLFRAAPDGMLWRSPHDNEGLRAVKRLARGLDLEEDERTRASRRVLQAYCHAHFEDGNQRLLGALGWRPGPFVQVPMPPVAGAELEQLDELWSPRASPTELALLWRALGPAAESLAKISGGRGAETVPRPAWRRSYTVGRRLGGRRVYLGLEVRVGRRVRGRRLPAIAVRRRRA